MTRKERLAATKLFLATPSTEDFPSYLLRHGGVGGEWEDTDATWHPAVLELYPDVPPPPAGTATLGIGYGELCALDESGRQLAVLVDTEWKAA